MLVKDYRGKDANEIVWKFDGGLMAQINNTLKQAAIEEGRWIEKRDFSGVVSMNVVKARLSADRQRVADGKMARESAAAKAKPQLSEVTEAGAATPAL